MVVCFLVYLLGDINQKNECVVELNIAGKEYANSEFDGWTVNSLVDVIFVDDAFNSGDVA